MHKRTARYGQHTYEVRVTQAVAETGVVYFEADSVVVKDGVLMLSAEMEPLEAEEWEETTDIEYPPCAIFAPGHWYSAVLVTDGDHRPLFAEGFKADDE